MSTVNEIEAKVRQLPRQEALALMDWLSVYLEDQAVLNPEFVASIGRGQLDLQDDRVRVRQP